MATSVLDELSERVEEQLANDRAQIAQRTALDLIAEHPEKVGEIFSDPGFLSEHADEIAAMLGERLLRGQLGPLAKEFGTKPKARKVRLGGAAEARAPEPKAAKSVPSKKELRERATSLGVRPDRCVAPGCAVTEKIHPGTGYTCAEHAKAPKETKRAWREAFILKERKKLGLPPSKRLATKSAETRLTKARDADAKILEVLSSAGRHGANNVDLVNATDLPIEYIRMRTWRLRTAKKIRTAGNTTLARHFIPE